MTPKRFIFIIVLLLTLARIFVFAPKVPQIKDAYAAYCSGGCPASCTTTQCCCGTPWVSCNPCDSCGTSCPCSKVNGTWGTCSTSTFKQTCGTAECGGTQSCTPAGGTQTCCAVATTCNITANYNTTGTTQTLSGCANGNMIISAGTTTVAAGETLLFGSSLKVQGGILNVINTGKLGSRTTCSAI